MRFIANRRGRGDSSAVIFWTTVACYVLTWALIPHVLLANKRPASTLAWIWAILLFPFLGALIYIFIGSERMTRRRLRRAKKLNLTRHHAPAGASQKIGKQSAATAALLRALANINEIPSSTATEVRLLIDASAFYPALKERIEQAQAPHPYRILHLAFG
jgi:cardiolipin synthase